LPQVLECLADEPDLTVPELAEALGDPRSSVYGLLASLQRLELV
jgi:DNA-binding IclR family transcriptional regulator